MSEFNMSCTSTYVLQSIQLSHESGDLKAFDDEVQSYPADVKHTLHFSLQGEQFFISACELRELLRARAPTPPQPIYDEAKERELFAEFSRRIVAHDAENFPIRWCDCVPDEAIEDHLNTWLACAQSRAKAGEVGHE